MLLNIQKIFLVVHLHALVGTVISIVPNLKNFPAPPGNFFNVQL